MGTKRATGFNASPHQAHYGNVAKQHFRHVFSEADKDGDVIRLGVMGFGKTYFSTQIASVSGLGSGVTVDIGYHGIESGAELPEFFVKGTSVASKMDVMLPTFRQLQDDRLPDCPCDEPEEAQACAPKWGELHEIVMTVHGNPAAGSCLDIVMEYEHNR